MGHFVYIIQSEIDGTFYIGSTQDPISRLQKHNALHKGFTSRKQPWKIVYSEKFENKQDALLRERFLKAQKSREFFQRLISGSSAG
ncbi:GIY-YIG nuclease family protein [Aquiflexum lacus]|uniref:GIY-YIG nuclease family protein n=1 Tax=Aquiflexum lacus TaxID=2483805 RepID=UPI0018940BBA|nr:GIY-YIG nuclease family protein [Aquiflexum lacus]